MAAERMIRVTHREREGIVEGLRSAYTVGCLDDGELDERTTLAYAAKTRGELCDLVSDLPPIPLSETPAEPCPRSWRADWSGWARDWLSWGCWLMLAAAGAWLIAAAARGVAAVPAIFLWLVSLRLCGLVLRRGQ